MKKLFLFLGVVFLLSLVSATSMTLQIPENINVGDEFIVNIYGNDFQNVSVYNILYNYDHDSLQLISITKEDIHPSISLNFDTGFVVAFLYDQTYTGDALLGTFKFKALKSGIHPLTNVENMIVVDSVEQSLDFTNYEIIVNGTYIPICTNETKCEGTNYYTCVNENWVSQGEVDGLCGFEIPVNEIPINFTYDIPPNIKKGDNFTISFYGNNLKDITVYDVEFNYSNLEVLNIENGNLFDIFLQVNQNSTVGFAVAKSGGIPFTGNGLLGKITFKALGNATLIKNNIEFMNSSMDSKYLELNDIIILVNEIEETQITESFEENFTSNNSTTITTSDNLTQIDIEVSDNQTGIINITKVINPGNDNGLTSFNKYIKIESDLNISKAIIKISYSESELGNLNENTLKIYYWNELTQNWDEINSWVDVDNNIVYAEVNHFSVYGIYGSVIVPTSSGSSGGSGGSSHSSGGICFRGWTTGEWSKCQNGVQTREVTVDSKTCYQTKQIEYTSKQSCEVEIIDDCQGDECLEPTIPPEKKNYLEYILIGLSLFLLILILIIYLKIKKKNGS